MAVDNRVDPFADQNDGFSKRRIFHALSKLEKAASVAFFVASSIEVARQNDGYHYILATWLIITSISLFAVFWPRTPRFYVIFAELFLAMVAMSHWIVAEPKWLPFLNNKNAWRQFGITPRQFRFAAFNLSGGLALMWLAFGAFLVRENKPHPKTLKGIVFLAIFLPGWSLLAALLYTFIQVCFVTEPGG